MMAFGKKYVAHLYQHSFVKNVITLQVGSVLGTLIQAGTGVFIARILQPELFGIYALAFSLASLFSIFMATGVGEGITSIVSGAHARGDQETIVEAFGFLLKVAFVVGLIILVGLFFLPTLSNLLYQRHDIGIFAGIVIVASVISNLFFSIAQVAFQMERKIKLAAGFIFLDQLTRWGLSLMLVFFGYGILGAAIGHLMGALIMFFVTVFAWNRLRSSDTLIPTLGEIIKKAKTVSWHRFIRYSFWVALDRNMATLFSFLPVSLAGIYLVSSDVAFYRVPLGFISLALSLLGPISVMLNIEFPRLHEENLVKMRANFLYISLCSFLFALILTTAAAVVAPFVFKVLYGQSFMPSAKYVYGFIIYGAVYGLGVGLGPMWRAIDKVKVSIAINLLTLGGGVPLGLFLIKYYNLWGAVMMVTLWYAVSHLSSFVYLMHYLNKRLPSENLPV